MINGVLERHFVPWRRKRHPTAFLDNSRDESGNPVTNSDLFGVWVRRLLREARRRANLLAIMNRGYALLALITLSPLAAAGESVSSFAVSAPMVNPHTLNLELDHHARRRSRGGGNYETSTLLDLTPGLAPLRWPRDSDLRARLLTPELRRAPVVGWIATNLYRSKRENGWCLEVDPGEGEYVVLYRHNL